MTVTAQHCLKFLQEMDSFPPPSKKLDPIAATPAELAYCCELLHKHNEQKNLQRRYKDDPANLPMSLLNFAAEHLDIPKDTIMFQKHPHLSEPSKETTEVTEQPSPAADPMTILYDCFFEKLDLDHLDPPDQPVDVTVFHPSTETVCSIQFPPFLPELPADLAVLNLAVSPDLGPPASNPITSVTYAQMLVSKIRPPAADNPLCPKILATTPPVNCLAPGTHFLEPSSVPLFNASDHLHLSWSTMLAKGRRPLRSNCPVMRPPGLRCAAAAASLPGTS
jgi:hypothetical protein